MSREIKYNGALTFSLVRAVRHKLPGASITNNTWRHRLLIGQYESCGRIGYFTLTYPAFGELSSTLEFVPNFARHTQQIILLDMRIKVRFDNQSSIRTYMIPAYGFSNGNAYLDKHMA